MRSNEPAPGRGPTGRRLVVLATAAVLAVALAVGLALFQPWKLFTHSRIDEALPGVSDATGSAVSPPPRTAVRSQSGLPAVRTTAPASPAPDAPQIVSRTQFVPGEHTTTGTALLVRLADGHYVVRLERFSTSDGPDVHVVLATAAAGSDGVGHAQELGRLKATDGNQNYPVEPGTDVAPFRSVTIWCRRFHAVFGSAPLTLPPVAPVRS